MSNTVVDTNDDTRRLYQLAQAGLLDVRKLPFLKRALSKSATQLTQKERSTMIDVFNHLLDTVLGNQQTFQRVKTGLKENRDPVGPEVKQDGNISSKFGQKWTQSKDPPPIILMKRRSIRQFPDGNRVALYYAPILNKFVSIPYGEIGVSESIDEAKTAWSPSLNKYIKKWAKEQYGPKDIKKDKETKKDISAVKKESFNLQELSKKTLGSYVTKASKEANAMDMIGKYKKRNKREKGMDKAYRKLNIQELSKKTLGSYIKKATAKGQLAMYDAGSKHREGKDNRKELRYGDKRYLGINKAVKKLSEGNIGRLDSMITEGLSSVDLVFGNDAFTFNNPGLAKQIVGLYESLENPTNRKLLDTLVNASEKDFNDAAAFAESMDIQELSEAAEVIASLGFLDVWSTKKGYDIEYGGNMGNTEQDVAHAFDKLTGHKGSYEKIESAPGVKKSGSADYSFTLSVPAKAFESVVNVTALRGKHKLNTDGLKKFSSDMKKSFGSKKLSEGKYGNMGSFSKGAPWTEKGRDWESSNPYDVDPDTVSRMNAQFRNSETKRKKDASSAKRKEQPYLPFGKNGLKFGKKKMTEGSDPGWNHIKSYLDWTPPKKKKPKKPVKEGFAPQNKDGSYPKTKGYFKEKEHGKSFDYGDVEDHDEWAKKHGLTHKVYMTGNETRFGKVKKTVAHIATDENPDGTPKMEKWKLKKHTHLGEATLGGLKYKGKSNPNVRHNAEDLPDKKAFHKEKKSWRQAWSGFTLDKKKSDHKIKRHTQAMDAVNKVASKLEG